LAGACERHSVVVEVSAMMPWAVLAILALLGIITVAVVRTRTPVPPRDADPLFVIGIVLAGTGAALIAAIGTQMVLVAIVGILLIAVGARRSRSREGRE
jgi:hypothetical protein